MEAITFLQHFKPTSFLQPPPPLPPPAPPQTAAARRKWSVRNSATTHFGVAEVAPETSYPAPVPESSFVVCNGLAVKARHAQIIKMSKDCVTDDKIQSLMSSYLELGDFESASGLFLMDYDGSHLCWKSFLDEFKGYGGDPFEILRVFGDFHGKGVVFDSKILTVVLKICGNYMDFLLGSEIHGNVIKRGLDLNVHVKCALMNFYGRCSGSERANQAFSETLEPESLLWNEAILVNMRNEEWVQSLLIFREMQHSFLKTTNAFVVARLLHACAKLEAAHEGKQIHGYVIRNFWESNALVSNALIAMYVKCSELELARIVFDSRKENRDLSSWNSIISGYCAVGNLNEAWRLFYDLEEDPMINPDVITWNCLLSGHYASGFHQEVLKILHRMQVSGFKPNSGSITSALQAVSELGSLNYGKEIHCFVLRNELDHDLHVGTSLLDMYVKNDKLINARTVFNNMGKNRNIFSWNCMISGYISRGVLEEALDFLDQMEKEGQKPDLVTYNALVSGYATSGHVEEALKTIYKMKLSGFSPNVVSWTALISGCVKSGRNEEALFYSIEMQKEGLKPNPATLASLLRACSSLSLLQKGKEVHGYCIRNCVSEDVYVSTALIDMYCKCGSLRSGYEVFEKIEDKKLTFWNSMIGGMAMFSCGKEAISLFRQMQEENVIPDSRTFTALLSGCKNSGLMNEGWGFFDSMSTRYNISPTIEHYSCMVDLLGRGGYLDEAWDLIQKMPMQADATAWGAFLASCKTHKNLEFGDMAAKKLFKLEPHNAANYILLMNLYSDLNLWDEVDRVKEMMEVRGIKARPVWSWTRIKKTVHKFYSQGRAHPEEGMILFELYQMVSEMKKSGYVPAVECVLQNIDNEEKEKILLRHTEKLAITYGFIHSRSGDIAPIRVVKNSRTCSDCHTMAKFMSKLKGRDIILRDGLRFHHFSDGKCSCNDFW